MLWDEKEEIYIIPEYIMSINIYDRKDMRGGGYAKRKFTLEEAEADTQGI